MIVKYNQAILKLKLLVTNSKVVLSDGRCNSYYILCGTTVESQVTDDVVYDAKLQQK